MENFANKADLQNVKQDLIKWIIVLYAFLFVLILGLYFKS